MNIINQLMFETDLQNYEDKRINNELNGIERTVAIEQAKINDAFDAAIELYNLCESYLIEQLTPDEKEELRQLKARNDLSSAEKERLEELKKKENESTGSADPKKNKDYNYLNDKIDKLNNLLGTVAKNTSSQKIQNIDKMEDTIYEPVRLQKVTEMKDLTFPENIKFLVTQIIDWVKRVIKYLISKLIVLFNRVLGKTSEAEAEIKKATEGRYAKLSDLKPEFTKAIKSLNTGILKPMVGDKADKAKNIPLKLLTINADELMGPNKLSFLSPLSESAAALLDGNITLTEEEGKQHEVKVVQLDTSSDLYALQQTVTHFFDLFDQSFGSNGEFLFDATDLALVFKTIKTIFDNLKKGNISTLALGNMNDIKSDKVYSNLVRTKANVDDLDKAYYQTYSQIDKIMKIVTSKQLYSLTQYGVQYACLSEYTYKAMNSLIDTIDRKEKDAVKLKANLEKLNKQFDDLTNELEKYRTALYGFGTMSVKSIYQEKFNDLFLSTKYLTQITTLRLTVLTKYIRELQDIRSLVLSLTNIVKAGRSNIVFDNAVEPNTAVKKRGLFGFLRR